MQTTHTFDYVVVGGGSAGAAVAARLSEDPAVTVGLLEAGPSDTDEQVVLQLNRWMELLESGFDWDYPIEPQENGNSFMRHARAKGARRLLVAQLVHRLLGAAGRPRRVGIRARCRRLGIGAHLSAVQEA